MRKERQQRTYPAWSKHTAIVGVLSLFVAAASAQQAAGRDSLALAPDSSAVPADTLAQPADTARRAEKTTVIYLEKSDAIHFDQNRLPGAQIIKGNPVRFRHDNAVMYCDSAYLWSKKNSFDAFGHVRIIEGDSIFIYGDLLFYDGNTRLARMRHNVRMENDEAVLTTDSLNYDRAADLAYYYTGGKLQDDQNTLTSVWGQYGPNTKQALFRDRVHLLNESFTMDADTLTYNTETKIAGIVGDTHIIYDGETDIYSTHGWYDTDREQSMLLDRSLIVHADGKTVTGDTLFYDKGRQYVEGFSRVAMSDTVQRVTLHGHYVFYNEATEYGLATDSAMLVDWSTQDSLFMHADTMTVSKDSVYDLAKAYYNVRFYRVDLQGACDSLVYRSRDSVATLYGQPVVWSGANQLSGDSIQAYVRNQTIDHIHVPTGTLAVQRYDSAHYNQVSGKELTAFMADGELYRVEVSGNAETIYYPVDEQDTTIIGLNKTQSSYVNMFFEEQQIRRIVLTAASSGTMYPLGELTGNDVYLNGFFWLDEQQPKRREDIFLVFPRNRHASTVVHSQSAASGSRPEEGEAAEGEEGDAETSPQASGRNVRPPRNAPPAK